MRTTAVSSMASSGSTARAPRGGTCPPAMALGRPATIGSCAGAAKASGSASSRRSKGRRMPKASWTGNWPPSIPPSCAPTSMREEPATRPPRPTSPPPRKKGELPSDPRRGARSEPRRVLDQAAPRLRRAGATAGDPPDRRPTARQHATGSHPRWGAGAAATRPPAEAAATGGRGQGVQLSQVPPRAAAAQDAPRDPGA